MPTLPAAVRNVLDRGVAIPAMPLALTPERRLDERRQRALIRYYAASGAGGLAVGVHTTQFAIRDPKHGLFEPVLALAAEELGRADRARAEPMVRIAGVCGGTGQAVAEAELARDRGYHAGLLSLAALTDADEDALVAHCRAVAEVIPLVGFYLQPSVGGRVLPYRFWRRVRRDRGRGRGEDRPVQPLPDPRRRPRRRRGGPRRHRPLHRERRRHRARPRDPLSDRDGARPGRAADRRRPARPLVGLDEPGRRAARGVPGRGVAPMRVPSELLRTAVRVTDANAAFFDAAHDFAGCIAGLHEVLRRQGLLAGTWCLDPDEGMGPGQAEEIDRVYRSYPELNDDAFVAAHRDAWLSG